MSWLAGYVKEVQSGDTVVISSNRLLNGALAEKRLNLASLSSPRMPRRDGSGFSEEFAWEAREFLRKLAVGRKCSFHVDYKVDTIDREFGTVIIDRDGTQMDLGMEVAKAGWAKVRGNSDSNTQARDIDNLRAAAAAAEAAGVGLYTSNDSLRSSSVFSFDTDTASTGTEALAAFGKGIPVQAVVDTVLTGSTVKIVTLPERAVVTLALAGAQSPNVRRMPDGALEGDPFGREARSFTELKVLNREVRAVLHSAEQGSRVYGELVYPDEGKAVSLAEALLSAGYARYVDWSARLLPLKPPAALASASVLKKAETAAQDAGAGMWEGGVGVTAARQAASSTEGVAAKVVEVVSGDTVVIRLADGKDVRLSLASLRAPRMRPQGATDPEPYAREAKEFVRATCIGADCTVALEYTRKVPPPLDANAAARAAEVVIQFGNIEVPTKRGPQQLAEMIVRRGFAALQAGRDGDDRSSIFGALLSAEEYAKGRRAGIHSAKESAQARINDVSAPGSGPRAKQYLPFFQRSGAVPCIVEHVMSGSRVRLLVPKESAVVAFSPSGVKTPSRGGPARPGMPEQKPEPFGEEAYQFMRNTFLQRDAMVTVESCDRSGTFLGRLVVGGKDMSLALLSSGLGSLHPSFAADRVLGASELLAAQEAAQKAKRGMWHAYDPSATEAEDSAALSASSAVTATTVTHVSSGAQFFVQNPSEERLKWVADECAAAAAAPAPTPTPVFRVNQKVLAKFSVDGQWYRAFIESISDKGTPREAAGVYFMDFGNTEVVPVADVRPMEAALAAVAPLATAAQLAYVRVPDLSDAEWGVTAAEVLSELVGGGVHLHTKVVGRTRAPPGTTHPSQANGTLDVILTTEEPDTATRNLNVAESVQAHMIRAGVARLVAKSSLRSPSARAAAQALVDVQEEALRKHVGIFSYGDPGDSDDE